MKQDACERAEEHQGLETAYRRGHPPAETAVASRRAGGTQSLLLTSVASTALQDTGGRLEEPHLRASARKEPSAAKACSKARVSAPLCRGKSKGKLTVNSGEHFWSSGGRGCKVM